MIGKNFTNIGITSTGGDFVSREIISLKKSKQNNFKIFAFNKNYHELSFTLADGFETIPAGDSPNYIKTILKLINKYKLNILLPWSDEEALTLSEYREEFFNRGCKILVSPKKVMNIITNKRLTYEKLKSAGLKIPEYTLVNREEDVKKCVYDYGYPNKTVILKPSTGRGGRGVYVFLGNEDNPPDWIGTGRRENRLQKIDEFSINFSDYDEWLVMPCLQAPVYDVDVFSVKGKMVNGFIRKRINPTGIPFTGNTIMNDTETLDYAKNICKALELDSLHDLDMMTHPKFGPVLIEVNPRPSGSIGALTVAGIPFLEEVLLKLIGKKLNLDFNFIKNEVRVLSFLEGKVL